MRRIPLRPLVVVALSLTICVTAYAAPQGDSVDAFFVVVGSGPESAAQLTGADVRAAIAAGAPLRSSGERDTTPLMYVAGYNTDPDVTRTLLGADIHAPDDFGWTILELGAMEGLTEVFLYENSLTGCLPHRWAQARGEGELRVETDQLPDCRSGTSAIR